jgi:hypothetical protein
VDGEEINAFKEYIEILAAIDLRKHESDDAV